MNESSKLVVTDPYELSTLHKAMHEAKFLDGSDNPVWTSPFVVAVANRLLDALIALDGGKPGLGSAEGWRKWRVADQSRLEWPICVRRARSMKKWAEWDDAKKREVAALLFAPLQLDETKMEEFLQDCAVEG